jgi:hypothetical protein
MSSEAISRLNRFLGKVASLAQFHKGARRKDRGKCAFRGLAVAASAGTGGTRDEPLAEE